MYDPGPVLRANGFRPWDAMAPAALFGILKRLLPVLCTNRVRR